MTFGHPHLPHWPLDPAVTYLNHGTVGVTPRAVMAARQALLEEIERGPSQFLFRELIPWVGVPGDTIGRLRAAATTVAAAFGARGSDLVFVDNATTGVSAVLRSLRLQPDDEMLTTDLAYGAVLHAARFVAQGCGAVVRVVPVPLVPYDPDAFVEAFTAAMTPQTRIAIIDHIASGSAIILPVERLVAACRARGVRVLVDGAHAPGVLPIQIPSLGADWYTANLHKWACAPRGSGFLWSAPDAQAGLHPPVISWGLDQGYTQEFDWVGTRDVSPWLVAPTALEWLRALGPDRVWAHNHGLACDGAEYLADRWRAPFVGGRRHVGYMATVGLPHRLGAGDAAAARVRDALLFVHHVEAQVSAVADRLWVRLSAQVYNEFADVERLAAAVDALS